MLRLKPKPGPNGIEPRSEYNRRIAKKIYSWFSEHGRYMLFQKVLRQIHYSAWDEAHTVLRNSANPFRDARTGSDRRQWDVLKSEPAAKRRREGLEISRTGPQSFWEDPFVSMWGSCWRDLRDQCTDKATWKSKAEHFVEELSKHWKLPKWGSKKTAAATSEVCTKRKLQTTPPHPPSLDVHPEDKDWPEPYPSHDLQGTHSK